MNPPTRRRAGGDADATATPDHVASFVRHVAVGDPAAPAIENPRVLDRVFVTDALCLSFVATVARWGGTEADRLYTADRFREWLDIVGLPAPVDEPSQTHWSLLRELRVSIGQLARALVTGSEVEPVDVCMVNTAARLPGFTPLLRQGMLAYDDTLSPDWLQIASRIASSAVETLAGPLAARVRLCEGEPCTHLFVDRSRGGARRWCTSEGCGNRARVRAFRGAHSASAAVG